MTKHRTFNVHAGNMTGIKNQQEETIICCHKQYGCHAKLESKDVDHHVVFQCMYRPANCEGCGLNMLYKDIFMHQKLYNCLDIQCKRELVASAKRIKSDMRHHRQEVMVNSLALTREKVQRQHSRLHEKVGYSPRVPTFPKPDFPRSFCNVSKSSVRSETTDKPENKPDGVGQKADCSSQLSTLPELTSTSNHDMYTAPSPSRMDNVVAICQQCNKPFREVSNHSKACIWHKGVSLCIIFLTLYSLIAYV